jgi:hypothetical protein
MSISPTSDSPFNSLQKTIDQLDGSSSNYFLKTRDQSSSATANGTYGAKSVSTSAVIGAVSTSNKSPRKALVASPTDGTIYWGFDSSVTTTTGMPIASGATSRWNVDANVTIYFIAAAAVNVRIAEF